MRSLKALILSLSILTAGFVSAQISPGATPCAATCATSGSYPSVGGGAGLGSWNCLGSTPNPNWVAVGVAQSGNVVLNLSQTGSSGNGLDVDFGVFGPYTSVSASCGTITPGVTPMVACSFSAASVETITIPGAVAGQVYIILITNFSNQAGTISLNPATPGSINCSINFDVQVAATPAKCNLANGTVTATPVGGYAPYTYSWNIPGNPTTATVNNVPPGTYTVTVTSSPHPTTGATANPVTKPVTVTNQNATFSAVSTQNASCPGGTDGTATANWTMQGGNTGVTASYSWSTGATSKVATGLAAGTYTCTITLSNGCVGNVTVTVNSNPVVFAATSTLVSCPGGSDGTATATMTPVVGTLSYQWNDPNAQNTATAAGLSAGSYTCTITSDIGCLGTATVAVTEIPGMTATVATQPADCNSKNTGMMGVSVTLGTPPYTYAWDNSSSTLQGANDLYAGTHTVTITDANGCIITRTADITEPAPLDITNIFDVSNNEFICPESSTTLEVTVGGGNGPTTGQNNAPNYMYTWTLNGQPYEGPNTNPQLLNVNPVSSGDVYCVTLSELCGSPTADTCITLNFPPNIAPNYITDKLADCAPAEFQYMLNLDDQSLEQYISTILLEFGDGQQVLLTEGNWDTTHTFVNDGTYISSATIISTFGCVTYEDTVVDPLTAIKIPDADFTFSANPTTMFETTVTMQDKSTSTVDQWTWYSPSSTPSASTQQNPEFTFPEGYAGIYDIRLIVETPQGCIDTVVKKLSVISDILFYAPNAFTPDGDEFNQTWKFSVDGIDRYNFELLIFNRWGEVIWETKDPDAEWDGTYHGQIMKSGAYSWRARVKALESDEKQEFSGVIMIID